MDSSVVEYYGRGFDPHSIFPAQAHITVRRNLIIVSPI
jgi:hypothetical protein